MNKRLLAKELLKMAKELVSSPKRDYEKELNQLKDEWHKGEWTPEEYRSMRDRLEAQQERDSN